MIKNPYVNAIIAGAYIAGLVLFMNNVIKVMGGSEDTILIPMTMLSLFVFSAAVMGALFVYMPAILILENQKKEALSFFTKTLATFFCILIVFFSLMVYMSVM